MSEEFVDLTDTIEDAVNDAVSGVEDTPEVSADPVDDSQPEVTEPVTDPAADTTQVPSPTQPEAPPQDDFEKAVGMSRIGVTGKENRIPYSRVKKITEKAVNDVAEAALGRKLTPGEKASDVVKQYVAQIPQLQGQVKDYENRLNTVGQFENVMSNNPQQFLTMLSQLPAYQQFFQFVENAYNALQAGNYQPQGQSIAAGTGQPQQPQASEDAMPEPDQVMADGSKVYSMDGLRNLMSWQSRQTENRVAKQFDARYKALESQYQPIRKEWENHQRVQSVLPVIRAQIAEARTWPQFNDHEAEITKALEQDRNLSLEAAYRKVVFPKLIADHNSMRQNIIKELQQAPTATAISGRQNKPTAPTESGPRKLEDIIKDSIETIR